MSLLAWKPPTNQQQFSWIQQFADIIKPEHTLLLVKPPWKPHPLLDGVFAFCEYLHPPHQRSKHAGGPRAHDPAQHRPDWTVMPPKPQPPMMPKSCTSKEATRPPRLGHTSAIAPSHTHDTTSCSGTHPSPHCPHVWGPLMEGKVWGLGTKVKGSWPPSMALPQPQSFAQKSSLVPKNLSEGPFTAVPRVTHSPSNWQLLPSSHLETNSAAKGKCNPCRESPSSRLGGREVGLCRRTMC